MRRCMPFKYVPDEVLEEAINAVMLELVCVDSLAKLRRYVNERLGETDPDYSVSHLRLRLKVTGMSNLRVSVSASENRVMTERFGGEDQALRSLVRCPVCGTKLKAVKNQTLYGWVVVVEKKCPSCHYWTGKKLRRPHRYEICLK